MRKKTFPIEEIKKLIDQDYKIVEIANYFNTSRVTMGKFLKENNLKTKKASRAAPTAPRRFSLPLLMLP